MVLLCQQNQIVPVPVLCYPAGTSYLALVTGINTEAIAIMRESGVSGYVDAYSALNDPSNPGAVLPAYAFGDGTHLNSAGYSLIGGLCASKLEDLGLV